MSDLISRQAAIDALKKISFSHWFECGEYISEDPREIEIINSNKAFEAIEALPSAQPEQKRGRWVAIDRRYVKCSECGLETTKNELRGIALFGENEPYFCPNCGANMRKENES